MARAQRQPQAATDEARGEIAEATETVKDRVFRISAELFAENGYHGTGVQELTEAIGLGRGALYYHIKSKEDLLCDISVKLLQELTERALQISGMTRDPSQRLRLLSRDLMNSVADHRAVWTVWVYESRALSDERRARVVAERDRYEAIWAQTFDDGLRAGQFHEVSPLLRRGILGLFNYSSRWFSPEGPMSPDEIADAFVSLIFDGIRRRPRERRRS
jgi:AcrR family transcriptional regulator